MAFFDAVRRRLGTRDPDGDARLKMVEAWGLGDGPSPEFADGKDPAADPAAMARPAVAGVYDRDQWRKKLARILDRLPDSEPEFDAMLVEAKALGLEDAYVSDAQLAEFDLLIRRAVADRVIEPQEHRKLELARTLIGVSSEEAVQLLDAIVAEAEAFFGAKVVGDGTSS